MAVQDWLLRIGDGEHFQSSSKMNIWGVDSSNTNVKFFMKQVKIGDHLWFVRTGGQIIAVSTFTCLKDRVIGPLITLTPTNEELGWTKQKGDWDKEVHFNDLYNLASLNLMAGIKSPMVVRLYNEKCLVDLPKEYTYITRYSKVTLAGVAGSHP